MTKEELEKYTVDFMNNETGSKYSNINSVLGKMLIKYAEVFQKRIAELEKRCSNYEMKISKMEKGTCDVCKETEKDKKIVELEKENAELEATIRNTKAVDESFALQTIQLTKAKEIIRELLNYDIILIDSTRKFEYMDLQKKAEDFLDSEVEK